MTQKVIVTVKEGKVRGFKTKSLYSGTEYYSFLGIPYGQSTEGRARFKDPVKVKPWKNVLDATTEKTGCLQFSLRKNEITGNEDCLYNNIHTTQIASKGNTLKAVIVNIHPGTFVHGSPDPDYFGSPEYIMNHDVVYVCVGFRLHLLGHLNLGLEECSGNQYLKDIILSLKWMKENIQIFGGDPQNITIMGSSSGSGAVHFLLLSPLARGLYHKAVLMGLYIFSPLYIYNEVHVDLAYEIACQSGYEGKIENRRKLLKFYKQLDFKSILFSKIYKLFSEQTNLDVSQTSFSTSPDESRENYLLPSSLVELIPSTNRVPIMIGFCEREGAMGVVALKVMNLSLSNCIHRSIKQNSQGWGANLNNSQIKEIQKKVQEFYLDGDQSMDAASLSTKSDIITDIALSDVYDSLINVVSSDPVSPAYVYQFTYNDGELYTLKSQLETVLQEPLNGTVHATDYVYWNCLLNVENKNLSQIKLKDRQMIDNFTGLISKFAKTGNPNSKWKSSTPKNPCYLDINENLELRNGLLNGDRMEFWHNIKKQFQRRR